MSMKSWCVAVATCVLVIGTAGPALSEISVKESGFSGGILVVRGETGQPSQRVTLDDRYVERTNNAAEFTFRVPYLPKDCLVSIKAGTEVYNAVVANCDAAGGAQRSNVPDASGILSDAKPSSNAEPVPTPGAAGGVSNGAALRVVRQPCERSGECQVICRQDEIALNAYCTRGSARLLNERTVSCAAKSPSRIVAYCMSR